MINKNQKVSVIGLGYIGLPTAAIIAKNGYSVTGIDTNKEIIETIEKGKIHIVEPDLDKLVEEVVKDKSLTLSSDYVESDIFIIAVPTPLSKLREPDLTYVKAVVNSIASVLKSGNLIILESTVPVGTTELLKEVLEIKRPDLNFSENISNSQQVHIAYCPERVLPGNILFELVNNDRVIGGLTKYSTKEAAKFYESFVKGQVHLTDSKTAELSKLVENSYRDVNIAFANELSLISEKFDINVWELINLANKHPRVEILQPGPGVGGHCIAVDPWFIVDSAPKESKLIKQAREVNDSKPLKIIQKIKLLSESIGITSEINITTLGLAFKKNIDDLRESPAMKIALEVDRMNFNSHSIVEPNIKTLPKILSKRNSRLCDLKSGLNNADLLLVLVDHDEFFDLNKKDLSKMIVVDTRGILEN